jgi:NAD(P)-dependent dehydrogenase (short-subunit alcohol dehydrogenase family)
MGRLDNKIAVITGAASGIGRATAIRFAQEGAAIVIGDLNADGGESGVRDCRENGGRAVFQKCNVESDSDIKSLIDRAMREYGRLDVMYNNAGLGGAFGTLEEIAIENWDRTMSVLLRAVFIGIKYAVPEMRKGGGGSIISTASVAGLSGRFLLHPYSAAKAAVINLTRTAALELGKDRIRVNCICPGLINTPLTQGGVPGGREINEKIFADAQALKRAGHPEDIANMALFLASDESEWVTGAAMVVDGGFTVGPPFALEARERPPGGYLGPSFEYPKQ